VQKDCKIPANNLVNPPIVEMDCPSNNKYNPMTSLPVILEPEV
jgi:hypothetical protein